MIRFYKILFKIGSFFSYLVRGMYFRRFKRIKLKLKDLTPRHRGTQRFYETERFSPYRIYDSGRNKNTYNWDKLKRRIKLFGLLNPLVIEVVVTDDYLYSDGPEYRVVDGNHRYIILNELYGEDYEVNCKLVPEGTSYFNKKPIWNWGGNYRKFNTPYIEKTLNDVKGVKNKMLKEAEESKTKLMQKYRMNVRVNTKN